MSLSGQDAKRDYVPCVEKWTICCEVLDVIDDCEANDDYEVFEADDEDWIIWNVGCRYGFVECDGCGEG